MTVSTLDARRATSAYGLGMPTMADARACVDRVYRDSADEMWVRLRGEARLTGHEDDGAALRRLIEAAEAAGDPVLTLVGRAQAIRLESFERLSAVHEIITAFTG